MGHRRTVSLNHVIAVALWALAVVLLLAVLVLLTFNRKSDDWARAFFALQILATNAAAVMTVKVFHDEHCGAIKDAYRLGREDGRGGRDGSDGGGVRSLSSR